MLFDYNLNIKYYSIIAYNSFYAYIYFPVDDASLPLDIMFQVTSEDSEKQHACIGLKHDLHCDHFATQLHTDLQTR